LCNKVFFYSGYVITHPLMISALTDICSLHSLYPKYTTLPRTKYGQLIHWKVSLWVSRNNNSFILPWHYCHIMSTFSDSV